VEGLAREGPNASLAPPQLQAAIKAALIEDEQRFDDAYELLRQRRDELRGYLGGPAAEAVERQLEQFLGKGRGPVQECWVYVYSQADEGPTVIAEGNQIFLRTRYGKTTPEVCAILRAVCRWRYENIQQPRAHWIARYFRSHKAKVARAAYIILGDVIANSIGNDWTYERLRERQQADSPPNSHPNRQIERVTKAVVPIIKMYLENGKEMDESFLDQYINIVEKLYPEASETMWIRLAQVSLITEVGIDVPYCSQLITKELRTRRITNKVSDDTTIYVGKGIGHSALRTLKKIPNKENDLLFITENDGGQLFIVIKTYDEKKIKTAIDIIKRMTKIQKEYVADL
jgi:hypothetical protein